MNYLAHIYLSGNSNRTLIGNYIADHVKGNMMSSYDPKIQKGIVLHRKIDTFTDQHPVVLQSKIRVREDFGKYAPVIVDVFYDHFLAKKWADFSNQPLHNFTREVYALLHKNRPLLPDHSERFLDFMIRHDILYKYKTLEGIDRALSGLAYRARFNSGMEQAVFELEKNYSQYEREFDLFFPDLENFTHHKLSQ